MTIAGLLCTWFGPQAMAQKAAPLAQHIVLVAHIDVMPKYATDAAALLKDYRKEVLKEKGLVNCKILQEAGRANHFSMVEEWAGQEALDTHVGTTASRQFREKVQPMLGAPVDERLHIEVE